MDGLDKLISNLKNLQENDKARRRIALTVHAKVEERIFRQSGSSDAKGAKLGRYSEGYRKQRRKKGLVNTQNIQLFFTGQMKEDFKIGVAENRFGRPIYASGFNNDINDKKSGWLEKKYRKKIFELTKNEEKLHKELTDKYVKTLI